MRPEQLVLRCFARPEGNVWVAVCIDLSLAAQAHSFAEARDKLDAQIREYLEDAVVGEDRASAGMLLNRKAPLSQRMTYHFIGVSSAIHALLHRASKESGQPKKFEAALPLVPAPC